MNKFYKEFGYIIQNKRIKLNLTQQEVADKIKCTRSCYANWEQGRRKVDIDTVYKICSVLKIDIVELTATMKKYV